MIQHWTEENSPKNVSPHMWSWDLGLEWTQGWICSLIKYLRYFPAKKKKKKIRSQTLISHTSDDATLHHRGWPNYVLLIYLGLENSIIWKEGGMMLNWPRSRSTVCFFFIFFMVPVQTSEHFHDHLFHQAAVSSRQSIDQSNVGQVVFQHVLVWS